MGGCAPSKMPIGEEENTQVPRRKSSSKLSFPPAASSSTSRHPPASLNASETRIKHLAVSDDNYEIVKGGRQPEVLPFSLPANGHLYGPDVMRDAGSQTQTNLTPDVKISRPNQFSPFTPRNGPKNLKAPLATIEPTSELGTPTPMEENKAFIRPYGGHSYLPQPGQQRPLHGITPPRFAFTPRASPSFPASASSPDTQTRPLVISPRAPPTTLIPPRSATATDNVMITTASASLGSFAIRAPSGMMQKPGSIMSVRSAGKEASLENVRASSSASTQRTPTTMMEQSRSSPQRHIDGDHKLEPLSSPPALPAKLQIPKLGLRPPGTSTGNLPRGPLASQHLKGPLSPLVITPNGPPKPARKSPQSQSGTGSPRQQEISAVSDTPPPVPPSFSPTKHAEIKRIKPKVPPKNDALKTTLTPRSVLPLLQQFSSEEYEIPSDGTDRADDSGSLQSADYGGEAMIDLPKVYKVSQLDFEEMLGSLQDVKILAQELLKVHEATDKTLQHRNGDTLDKRPHLKENGSAKNRAPLKNFDRLQVILQPPTEEILNDPAASLKLIKELQATVLQLYAVCQNVQLEDDSF